MKILIFGASGRTGSYITKHCLANNHITSIYGRSPYNNSAVTSIIGDIFDAAQLQKEINNHDIIICSLGNRDYSDTTKIVSSFMANALPIIKLQNKHIIIIAGSGILQHDEKTLRRDLPNQPAFLVNQRADHWEAYNLLLSSGVSYTLLCAPQILDKDYDNNYIVEENYLPKAEKNEIMAGNIAHFIVNNILQDINNYKDKRIGIINS